MEYKWFRFTVREDDKTFNCLFLHWGNIIIFFFINKYTEADYCQQRNFGTGPTGCVTMVWKTGQNTALSQKKQRKKLYTIGVWDQGSVKFAGEGLVSNSSKS